MEVMKGKGKHPDEAWRLGARNETGHPISSVSPVSSGKKTGVPPIRPAPTKKRGGRTGERRKKKMRTEKSQKRKADGPEPGHLPPPVVCAHWATL